MTRLCPPSASCREWENASINKIHQPTVTGRHPPHDKHGYYSPYPLVNDPLYSSFFFFFGVSCIHLLFPVTITTFTYLIDQPQGNVQCSQGITCVLFPCFLFSHAVHLPLVLSGCLLFSLNVSFSLIVLVIFLLFYLPSIFLCHSVFNSRCFSLLFARIDISLFCLSCSFILLCNILSLSLPHQPRWVSIPSFSYCQCYVYHVLMTGDSFYSIYSMMFLSQHIYSI